jgi:hypothetical protein
MLVVIVGVVGTYVGRRRKRRRGEGRRRKEGRRVRGRKERQKLHTVVRKNSSNISKHLHTLNCGRRA